MNNLNKQEYITAYRKMHSTINQVYNKIKFDNGGDITGVFTSSDQAMEVFSQYVVDAKFCKQNDGNCFPKKWYNGSTLLSENESNFSSLVLNDGSMMLFLFGNSECTSDINSELVENKGCFRIRTDINGNRGPNRVGRDIYDFYVLDDMVIARGHPLTNRSPNENWGAGYRILQTGKL